MKYRTLGATELEVSTVGFGVWSVSTNWWGKITEDQGVDLLVKAFDLGVNFFDTADTYGVGYGEEILAKALRKQRHDIVIGTKFGYDFYDNLAREGHQGAPAKVHPGVHPLCLRAEPAPAPDRLHRPVPASQPAYRYARNRRGVRHGG